MYNEVVAYCNLYSEGQLLCRLIFDFGGSKETFGKERGFKTK
jgi:hypothetical protein